MLVKPSSQRRVISALKLNYNHEKDLIKYRANNNFKLWCQSTVYSRDKGRGKLFEDKRR